MHGTLSPQEWYGLNRFAQELTGYQSPVLSLYLPSYEVAQGSRILAEKENKKDLAGVREAIANRLDSAKYHSGSICLFGWSKKGRSIVKHVRISKEVPPLYVVQRKPYLKPLKDILEIGHQVLVLIMDHKKAKIEVYNGGELVEEIGVRSYLKGRHKKGGQSAKRFNQNRKLQIRYFFNKVSQQLSSLELESIELILLGGRGLAKREFFSTMGDELARKTHILERISFETPKKEITTRVISILDKTRKVGELKALKGLETPVKHGLVISRNKEIEKRIRAGAVRILFLAADYHASSPDENSLIRRIIGMAKKRGTTIEFITDATARKRLHKFGNLVALLRYSS